MNSNTNSITQNDLADILMCETEKLLFLLDSTYSSIDESVDGMTASGLIQTYSQLNYIAKLTNLYLTNFGDNSGREYSNLKHKMQNFQSRLGEILIEKIRS